MGSWSLVQWTTHSHTETTINEKIYGRDEKFVTAFEQKKSAITTHFQPLRVTLHELLYLCLGESETIEFDAQAAKHILKCAVADYFMDLHSSFFSRRSDSDYIAIPMVEIRINVAEDVRSSRKRFVTMGWIDHQSLASGNKPKTVIHDRTKAWLYSGIPTADEMTLWPKMALFNQYPLQRRPPLGQRTAALPEAHCDRYP
jgi:hypothetical protein